MTTVRALVESVFSGSAADTMVGICLAESGGNAYAYNPNAATGDKSYGLFQINMIGSLGPERRQAYGLANNDALFDANTNIRVAYSLSGNGNNFDPWTTYKSGAYIAGIHDTGTEITFRPENGSPNTDGGGTTPPPGSGGQPKSGHYVSVSGKHIADPPVLPVSNADLIPDQTTKKVYGRFSAAQESQMYPWLLLYFDGTPPIKSDALPQETINLYIQSVAGNGGDPGGANQDQIPGTAWIGELGTLLSWVTDPTKLKRIGLGLIGVTILLFAVFELFGGTKNVVGKVV